MNRVGDDTTVGTAARRTRRGLPVLLALVAAIAVVVPLASRPAGASHGSSGSIVHTRGSDIWLASPDGTAQVRVTNNGAIPSPDGTGDTEYFSPSQSDLGNLIVAVRNQLQPDGSTRGFLWVMDRQGNVIRKLSPPQYGFSQTTCTHHNRLPQGIFNARISPDGSKIVYEDAALLRDAFCARDDQITAIRVVNLDGSNPQLITRSDGSNLDLRQASWASSTRLLLLDTSGVMSYVDLPDPKTRPWFSPEAHQGANWPVLKGDKLATVGPSTFFGQRELLLWTANGGPPTAATPRCALTDPVRSFFTPTWAPGGSAVAWWEANADDPADTAGRGIWAVSVGDLAATCPTRANAHLIVPGGAWPYWGPAPVTTTNPPSAALPADFDGDGDTDVSVFRPANGYWFVNGGAITQFGTTGDIAVPGDYDGDGDADVAVYRPSNGYWFVNGGAITQWGTTGDIPVPGDYDGDGDTDVAVYRASTGYWFVNGGAITQWGTTGDIPVPGDYDGDGDTDIAVFRPSNGYWFVSGGAITQWGTTGDIPLPLPDAIRRVFFPSL